MAVSGASGLAPLTWQELESFSGMSGNNLLPFEAETLIDMSRAYCSAYHDSQEPASPAPWVDDSQDALEMMRDRVAAKFRALSSGKLPQGQETTKKPRKRPSK